MIAVSSCHKEGLQPATGAAGCESCGAAKKAASDELPRGLVQPVAAPGVPAAAGSLTMSFHLVRVRFRVGVRVRAAHRVGVGVRG